MTIPTQWYSICKLKKVEVMAQLTAKEIAFKISQHHMTLKSLLYKASKAVQDLLSQFKAIVGNDWTKAWRQSGKSFKKFQKDLLIKFHPDKHNGCKQASDISKTITGWSEPVVDELSDFAFIRDIFMNSLDNLKYTQPYVWEYMQQSQTLKDFGVVGEPEVVTQELIDELYQQRYDQWTRKGDHTIDPLSDKYYMMREVQELLAQRGLTYDFTNEAWYIKYQAEVEERRNDNIFLQYI